MINSLSQRSWVMMGSMGAELRPFRRQLREPNKHDLGIRGNLWGTEVLLLRTGMGKDCAFFCHMLPDLKVKGILIVGIAGALDSTLRPGVVVIADEVVAGTEKLTADPLITRGLMEAANRACVPWKSGHICTVNQFVNEKTLRDRLFAETKALAVDMETYYMAEYAQRNQLPFGVLRSISDEAGQDALVVAAVQMEKSIRQYEKIVEQWL